jgi:hypothetical protein
MAPSMSYTIRISWPNTTSATARTEGSRIITSLTTILPYSRTSFLWVWEVIYIIEGLLQNTSAIQPKTVHADTQGNPHHVCLAHLLGIKLMPRIRVQIPKGKGKTRPLGITTLRDRIVQKPSAPFWTSSTRRTSSRIRMGFAKAAARWIRLRSSCPYSIQVASTTT